MGKRIRKGSAEEAQKRNTKRDPQTRTDKNLPQAAKK